jgi:hypothetical protein
MNRHSQLHVTCGQYYFFASKKHIWTEGQWGRGPQQYSLRAVKVPTPLWERQNGSRPSGKDPVEDHSLAWLSLDEALS